MINHIKEQIKNKLDITSLNNISEFDLNVANSTVNKMANKGNYSIYGFYITANNVSKKIVAKRKTNAIVINTGILLNEQNSKDFENIYRLNCAVLGLNNSDIREHLIYKGIIDNIKIYMPKYLDNIQNSNENILLLEYFDNSHNKINDNLVIEFLTNLHSYYLNKKGIVKKFMLNYCSIEEYQKSIKLLLMIFSSLKKLYKEVIPKEVLNNIKYNIENLDNIIKKMYSYHLTFNHGDFTYKNMCLVDNKLCVFDWEMASYLNPQFDVVNYLCYSDLEGTPKEYIEEFINKYINNLENKANLNIDKKEFYDIFKFNVDYFFIIRLMSLLVIHNKMPMPHIEKVLKNWLLLKETINNK